MSQPTRILILGGGFGGVYTALTLEKLLGAEIRRGEVELGWSAARTTSCSSRCSPRSSPAASVSST